MLVQFMISQKLSLKNYPNHQAKTIHKHRLSHDCKAQQYLITTSHYSDALKSQQIKNLISNNQSQTKHIYLHLVR